MSTSKRDYYEVLGVSKNADEAELKKSYRRLAMEYHPDRRPGDREAEEKFKEAAEAYSVLSDPDKRRLYDRYGHQGPSQSGFSGFGDVGDIFSAFADIFGGFGGGRRVPRGDDIEVEMAVSFMEAAKGCRREVEIERHVSCETCRGSGAKPGTQPHRCRVCQGRGQVAHQQGFFVISTTCPQCRGKGTVIVDKCATCRGSGLVAKTATVTVTVPAGIDDGQKLRMSYQGEPAPAPNGEAGDLYVLFRVQPDPRFVREGDNLWVDLPLTFAEAALGATVQVPTPDGPETVQIPAGTQPMTKHVLSGRGMPNVRGRGRGDVIARMVVQVPKQLTPESRELLEKLAPHLGTPRSASDAEASEGEGGDQDKNSVFERIWRGKKKKS